MFAAAVLTALLLVPAAGVPSGTVVEYEGRLVAAKGEPADTQKLFELTLLVTQAPSGRQLFWVTDEAGRGGFHWTERLGRLELDGQGNFSGQDPALAYRREEGDAVIRLLPGFLGATPELRLGARWKRGKLQSTVVGATKTGGKDCWRVEVRSPFGRKRSVLIEKTTGLIVALDEVVFMGQGEQHELRFRLKKTRRLDSKAMARTVDAFRRLDSLRGRLGRKKQNDLAKLTAEQVKQLRAQLPSIQEAAKETLLASLVSQARRDLNTQGARENTVAALRKLAIGKKVSELTLKDLRGEKAGISLKGATVLHFWQYRDKPLREPYGQAAYLDFLFRKREREGVQVIGIHVDPRVSDRNQWTDAVRTAKKFRAFMNLKYPLLVDDGAALREVGDPRRAGAKLPLFVVLDRAGKVIHYKVGFYKVDPRRGLVELDGVLTKALKGAE